MTKLLCRYSEWDSGIFISFVAPACNFCRDFLTKIGIDRIDFGKEVFYGKKGAHIYI